jgi:hypothetical protein
LFEVVTINNKNKTGSSKNMESLKISALAIALIGVSACNSDSESTIVERDINEGVTNYEYVAAAELADQRMRMFSGLGVTTLLASVTTTALHALDAQDGDVSISCSAPVNDPGYIEVSFYNQQLTMSFKDCQFSNDVPTLMFSGALVAEVSGLSAQGEYLSYEALLQSDDLSQKGLGNEYPLDNFQFAIKQDILEPHLVQQTTTIKSSRSTGFEVSLSDEQATEYHYTDTQVTKWLNYSSGETRTNIVGFADSVDGTQQFSFSTPTAITTVAGYTNVFGEIEYVDLSSERKFVIDFFGHSGILVESEVDDKRVFVSSLPWLVFPGNYFGYPWRDRTTDFGFKVGPAEKITGDGSNSTDNYGAQWKQSRVSLTTDESSALVSFPALTEEEFSSFVLTSLPSDCSSCEKQIIDASLYEVRKDGPWVYLDLHEDLNDQTLSYFAEFSSESKGQTYWWLF